MPINSRRKGKTAELAWAQWLRTKLGVSARRGKQYAGHEDAPDVISGIEGVFWEVKHRETESPRKWTEQAFRDAGPADVPAVAFKRNRKEWLICIRADDVIRFSERIVNR